ncbi:unnamed protein product [Auanema sp. JU1783]|nr:unnamed protein product [Auanema sp. JU1783]
MEDILLHTFGYLNANDLMRCRNVCQLWRRLASKTFARRRILNFETDFQKSISDPLAVSSIIELYGRNLEELHLTAVTDIKNYSIDVPSTSPYHLTRHIIESICLNCPKIRKIYINRMIVTLTAIGKMIHLPSTLEIFSIETCQLPSSSDCRPIIERSLSIFLRKMENMQEFHLLGDFGYKLELSSSILEHLPSSIKKLSISGALMRLEEMNFLEKKKITSLTLNYLLDNLSQLDSVRDSLEYLDISKATYIRDYQSIAFLYNLRELHMNETDVDDDCLSNILNNCRKIENLSISKCSQLTLSSLNQLGNLKNLKTLNISYCCRIPNEIVYILIQCEKLRDLDISHCHKIKPDYVDILRQKFNLRRLWSVSHSKLLPLSVLERGNLSRREFIIVNPFPFHNLTNR